MGANSLQHFGILGMKWGVRRTPGPDGKVSSGRKQSSEDYKQSRTLKSKETRELSTAELKALTNRLQLERQYKDLSPKDINKGLNMVKSITAAGTTLAGLYTLYKTPAATATINGLKKIISAGSEAEKMKWLV